MIEGLIIGILTGITVPVGIGVLGTRFITRNPEVIARYVTRKMISASKSRSPEMMP
jgi:hypothetical protein